MKSKKETAKEEPMMEKRAVVQTQAEKKAHDKEAKKHGQVSTGGKQ
jgi:hypothetical protein